MSPITAAIANRMVPMLGFTDSKYVFHVWNPERIRARGPGGCDEVARTPDDDEDDADRSEIEGGMDRVLESPFGSGVEFCFWGLDFVGCRILYFSFPLAPVVVGGDAGIGTGVAVLDVFAEPDKESGTLIEDMESGSNGLLAFPFNLTSSCTLANLDLAVSGVSVFSLDSLDEDSAGDDGRECDRERDGERAGVEGVLER